MEKHGVYRILNLVTLKCYIGSTINLNKRKNEHFKTLKKHIHKNIHLQRSFNKYGEANFEFQILEHGELENLRLNEWKWIKILKTNDRYFGYNFLGEKTEFGKLSMSFETKTKLSNIKKGRKGTRPNYTHSEETKKKISESNKGKKMSKEFRLNISNRLKGKIPVQTLVSVVRIDKFNLEKDYISLTEAAKDNKILITSISNALSGLSKTAGGFKWKYKN